MRQLKKYIRYITIGFRGGTAYRLDYFAGVVNIVFIVLANVILWKSLYQSQNLGNSIQHRMMITYIILSVIFQTVFIMDEMIIERKMWDGSIIHFLLKPVSFRLYIFCSTLGKSIFNLVMLFVPSVTLVTLIFHIVPPYSWTYLAYYIVSVVLGYLVLYTFNFMFWTFSFEYMTSWGIISLKNALIVVLSGALIPLWFMPEEIANVLKYLPFQSIYYFPLSIYLGIVPEAEIVSGIITQVSWVAVFAIAGHFIWKRAVREIVVQGG
jgi:ABC-2 type transport system permease protein